MIHILWLLCVSWLPILPTQLTVSAASLDATDMHLNRTGVWSACDSVFCTGNKRSICESLRNCQCSSFNNNNNNNNNTNNINFIDCRSPTFSAKFAITYSETSPKSVNFHGVNVRNGSVDVIFRFLLSAVESSREAMKVLSFINFCPQTLVPKQVHEQTVLNISHVVTMTKLQQLNLRNNCISSVICTDNESFPHLTSLDLSQNRLETLPGKMFATMPRLHLLNITANKIKSLDSKDFQHADPLQTLLFNHNDIQSLEDNVFQHLSKLKDLRLDNNKLRTLPERTFENLVNLRELSLGHNQLRTISQDLFCQLKQLRYLDLSNNRLTTISKAFFHGLENLSFLNLEGNMLTSLEKDTLINFHSLEVLNLNNNNLTEIPVLTFTNLSNVLLSVYLANNHIETLHLPVTSRIRQSRTLDLSNNCITQIFVQNRTNDAVTEEAYQHINLTNCCLKEISPELLIGINDEGTINFTGNFISTLTMEDLYHFTLQESLTVDLSYNNISYILVEWKFPLIGNSSFDEFPDRKIILHHNPVVCDCHLIPFFQYVRAVPPDDLTHVDMLLRFEFQIGELYCAKPSHLKNTIITRLRIHQLQCEVDSNMECPEQCHCHYLPSDDSLEVNCTETNLTTFPTFGPSLLNYSEIFLFLKGNCITSIPVLPDEYWEKISLLNLRNNRLTSVRNLKTNRLDSLFLDNNRLQHVESPLLSILSQNKTGLIALSGNPWVCDCNLLAAKNLILDKRVNDAKDITCDLQDGSRTVFLQEASDRDICPTMFIDSVLAIRVAVPVAIVFASLFTLIFVVIRRFSDEIKLMLFTHGLCLRFVTEDDIDADKVYDAFVSYSNKDDDWVASVLVEGLEEGTPPYTLCLHERDWPGGEWIPNQIARSVQQSRRTIIVLTENFVSSNWSKLEFQAAYQQMLEDNIKRVLIVVPHELPPLDSLDDHLKTFISVNTYIRWDKPNFWTKLRCAMPRVRTVARQDVSNSAFNSHI